MRLNLSLSVNPLDTDRCAQIIPSLIRGHSLRNFARAHKALRSPPAIAAGVANPVGEIEDIVEMIAATKSQTDTLPGDA